MVSPSASQSGARIQLPPKIGPYAVHERVNAGGMAEIFLGTREGFDGFEQEVAIKRILPHIAADPGFIQMFQAEAKLAVQLKHGNIAQIYQLGRDGDSFYIALEYVDGCDLGKVYETGLRLQRPLGIPHCCYVLASVCEALDYAHAKTSATGTPLNIIHRDISPPNILVSYEGEVKVVDFGLAKATTTVETQKGVVKGKIAYLSPEQARGQAMDGRSDIFSAGIVLFEMLTGRRLFRGSNDLETLNNVRACQIPRASDFNPKIPWRLERILLRSLAMDPEARYQSAGEMHRDLTHFLVTAGLPTRGDSMGQWMRSHIPRRPRARRP